MPAELLTHLPSLGIAGLLFVMWWAERQERTRGGVYLRDAVQHAGHLAQINKHLLDVIQANTAALTALREELRSYRVAETQWRAQLMRQLDELSCQ